MTPNTLGGGLPDPCRFAATVVDGAMPWRFRFRLVLSADLHGCELGNAHDPIRDFEKAFSLEQSQGIADAVKFAFVRPKCTSQALDPALGADHLPVVLGEAVQQIANAARVGIERWEGGQAASSHRLSRRRRCRIKSAIF